TPQVSLRDPSGGLTHTHSAAPYVNRGGVVVVAVVNGCTMKTTPMLRSGNPQLPLDTTAPVVSTRPRKASTVTNRPAPPGRLWLRSFLHPGQCPPEVVPTIIMGAHKKT